MSQISNESELTRFIRALTELKANPQIAADQYKATAYVMDAVHGTQDLTKLTYKTLKGAKANMQKAFKVSTLLEYVQSKGFERIEPFLAGQGDIVVATGEGNEHHDIAFCAGKYWLYYDDETLMHDAFSVHDYEASLIAFRLTK